MINSPTFFERSKVPIGKDDYSSGMKLPLGKLHPALFGVHINSPTGNIIQLHDAYRGKFFEGGNAGLTGFPFCADISYSASVGASENYQFLVKVYYACDMIHGGDTGNVNGTEVLDGEPHPIPKVYLNQMCQWDFRDVRFALKGYTGSSFYTYRLIEKVNGVSALFIFKMTENPDIARTVTVYWGKQTAVDESSDAAVEAIIPNAVLSMPLDEEDAEQNPVVIFDSETDWQTTGYGTGTKGLTVTYDSVDKIAGTQSAVFTTNNTGTFQGLIARKPVAAGKQNWSASNVLNLYMKGINTNTGTLIIVRSSVGNRYSYTLLDNWVGWKWVTIPFSSFTVLDGTPTWNTVITFDIQLSENFPDNQFLKVSRVVIAVGVTAKDYSGNGNHGATTGTTIVPHPLYPNKTARKYLYNGDRTIIPANALFEKTKFTILFTVQPQGTWTTEVPRIMVNDAVNCGWDVAFSELRQIIFARNGDGVTNGWKHQTLTRVIGASETVKVAIVVDGVNRKIILNDEAPATSVLPDTMAIVPAVAPLYLSLTSSTLFGRMILSDVAFIPDVALTDEQIYALHGGVNGVVYPDPYLEQGKIYVRKWASTTLPTVASVSSMQVRRAYGKQELYPALDNLNFSLDQANKKASVEFYLENTQLRSPNTLILSEDDGASYWTIMNEGTGTFGVELSNDTTDTPNGSTSSLKITAITGTCDHCYLKKNFVSPQNWTTYDFIGYYVKGRNSGRTRGFQIWTGDISGTNRLRFSVVDNFIGWKLCVFPVRSPTVSSGTPNLADVRAVILWDMYAADFTESENWVKYDSFTLDVGVWAKVEIGVPDKLLAGASNIALSSYNAGTLISPPFFYIDCTGTTVNNAKLARLYYLNGQHVLAIYGGDHGGFYLKGKHGEQSLPHTTSALLGAPTITYKKAKTRYRVGFAIKMPPADLHASATTGGGQVKLKLELYYV